MFERSGHWLSRVCIPDPRGPVVTPSDYPLTVRTKLRGRDRSSVFNPIYQHRTGLYVPGDQGQVAAVAGIAFRHRDYPLSIRSELRNPDWLFSCERSGQRLPGLRVPDPRSLVLRPSENSLAIQTELC